MSGSSPEGDVNDDKTRNLDTDIVKLLYSENIKISYMVYYKKVKVHHKSILIPNFEADPVSLALSAHR